ncbi:class I SAM-dependent methyltransferase [Symbioplanes lichenis]|uniref:class I SAM-dependent methyltransferase n=1 Tax=Symbioplanes lichenis TaxID=1629072 RepID=UPI0027381762|nr:class I SAM-dependent methyltransferase [Actinoplanes lichenis]
MALFDPIAELYARYAEITDAVYRPHLARLLPAAGARGVDLGCGSGRFTGLLADRCAHVLAVDIAEREVAIARVERARPTVEYRIGSLLDVSPDEDGRFDVVLSVNTLFHLFAQHDVEVVLRHVRSLVAPGGTAVIVDIVSPGPRALLMHRWWGLTDAVRTLRRRRSISDAWTVLRLRQHPVWMRHARLNQPLTRPDFHRRYAGVFAGAEFADTVDPFACALVWRDPDHR